MNLTRTSWFRLLIGVDRRRQQWRIKPLGYGCLMLVLIVGLLAGVGLVRGIRGRVALARVVSTDHVSPAAGSGRPQEWSVWQETRQGSLSYVVPDEIQAQAAADLVAALDWWQARQMDPDKLATGLEAYFGGPELARREQSLADMQVFGVAGLVYWQEPLPDGQPAVEFVSSDASGQSLVLAWRCGRRLAALYRLADGELVPESQLDLPAVEIRYRLAFDPAHRRWLVAEQLGQKGWD